MGEAMTVEELEELKAERLAAMRRYGAREAALEHRRSEAGVAPAVGRGELLPGYRRVGGELARQQTPEVISATGMVPCPLRMFATIARDRCIGYQRGGCTCTLARAVRTAARVGLEDQDAEAERRAKISALYDGSEARQAVYPPWKLTCSKCGRPFEAERHWGRKPKFCPVCKEARTTAARRRGGQKSAAVRREARGPYAPKFAFGGGR